MKKNLYSVFVLAAFVTLSGCNKPAADKIVPEPTIAPTKASLSAADKAAVDALGSDLLKLAKMVQSSSGAQREYADTVLTGFLEKATDLDIVEEVFDTLPPGSGYAKGAAISAKNRLKK